MHANSPDPHKQKWHERFIRSGFFLGAVLFHLILFLMVATLVIWKAPPPPPTDVFHGVAVKTTPPPPQPPSSGAEASNPQFEPQPVVMPVVTPPSVITTLNSSAFKVDAPKVLDQTLSHLSDQMAQGTGLSSGGGGTSGTGSAFGSSTGTSALLTGYLIDLKQTSDKKPTGMNIAQYYALLTKYISQKWDDSMFEPYYKSKTPIYTDFYAISTRLSEEAPKAFGVEKEVQAGLWVIHYHARVEAPQEGEYRFAGFADNVLMVKISGETVLDAGFEPSPLSDKAICHQKLPYAFPRYIPWGKVPADAQLRIGPTFHLDAVEPVDMDVLIGDDGGQCNFFLLIEREGNTYEQTPDGTPKLPFFQLGTGPAPTFQNGEDHPPYSTTPEPWTGAP